jgi:hypothetical protein
MDLIELGQFSNGLLLFQSFDGDLGLEICALILSFLSHNDSKFKVCLYTLTYCPKFGEYYKERLSPVPSPKASH